MAYFARSWALITIVFETSSGLMLATPLLLRTWPASLPIGKSSVAVVHGRYRVWHRVRHRVWHWAWHGAEYRMVIGHPWLPVRSATSLPDSGQQWSPRTSNWKQRVLQLLSKQRQQGCTTSSQLLTAVARFLLIPGIAPVCKVAVT